MTPSSSNLMMLWFIAIRHQVGPPPEIVPAPGANPLPHLLEIGPSIGRRYENSCSIDLIWDA
eukprot:scaffold704376_cov75-Attheya_sp.AAC.1